MNGPFDFTYVKIKEKLLGGMLCNIGGLEEPI